MLELHAIDQSWTLFLDRDGVINHDKPNSYVMNKTEFAFYDGVLPSLEFFNRKFGNIIVVTNQRGVGRGLMTEQDLIEIHQHMTRQVNAAGGRMDRIYYCISNDNEDPNRKPNPGMAYQAKRDFPGIDFSRSLMIGNNISDMQFGRRAGMHTVFLKTTNPEISLPDPHIDLVFDALPDFAKALQYS